MWWWIGDKWGRLFKWSKVLIRSILLNFTFTQKLTATKYTFFESSFMALATRRDDLEINKRPNIGWISVRSTNAIIADNSIRDPQTDEMSRNYSHGLTRATWTRKNNLQRAISLAVRLISWFSFLYFFSSPFLIVSLLPEMHFCSSFFFTRDRHVSGLRLASLSSLSSFIPSRN